MLQLRFGPEKMLVPSEDLSPSLVSTCADADISGGAVYDALIGLTALENGATLITRDERAERTYRLLDVEVIWAGS